MHSILAGCQLELIWFTKINLRRLLVIYDIYPEGVHHCEKCEIDILNGILPLMDRDCGWTNWLEREEDLGKMTL